MRELYEKYLEDFKAMDKQTRGKKKNIFQIWCEKLTEETGQCVVYRDFEEGKILARSHVPQCKHVRRKKRESISNTSESP